jgi:hypothetical protein
MLPPLGKLVLPDPPEKWKAIEAALDSDEKTRRMRELIQVNARGPIMCLALFAFAAVVLAVLALVLR